MTSLSLTDSIPKYGLLFRRNDGTLIRRRTPLTTLLLRPEVIRWDWPALSAELQPTAYLALLRIRDGQDPTRPSGFQVDDLAGWFMLKFDPERAIVYRLLAEPRPDEGGLVKHRVEVIAIGPWPGSLVYSVAQARVRGT